MGANERLGLVLMGTLIGATVGFGLAYLLRPAGPGSGTADDAQRGPFVDAVPASPTAAGTELQAPDRDPEREPGSQPRTELDAGAGPEPREEGLISSRLAQYAENEMREGWASRRTDDFPAGMLEEGLLEWRATVLTSPAEIGKRLGHEANELEAARAVGAAFELFTRLELGAGPMLDLVTDAEAFTALFEPETPARATDATQLDWRAGGPVPDGSTLRFPPGVFQIGDLGRHWDEFPRDVTLQGAGRDATLLVGEVSARSAVRNLSLRDMTFHNPGGGLAELRRGGAVISIENLRLTGWDTGAGGSSAINTRALAFLAKDCEIAGGYGRNPGFGQLFDVRTDALLARFEGCTLDRMSLSVSRVRPGATVVFAGCALTDVFQDPARQRVPPGVQFIDCTLTVAEGSQSDWRTEMKRDLNDLFPDWERRMTR